MMKPEDNSEVEIKRLGPENATLKDAAELAMTFIAAFAKDPIVNLIWGRDFSLGYPVPAKSIRKYKILVLLETWRIFGAMQDLNSYFVAAYKGGRLAAFCMWKQPASIALKIALWYKVRAYVITGIYKLITFWYFGWATSPSQLTPRMIEYFERALAEAGIPKKEDKKEYEKKLAHMSRDELVKTRYAEDEYHWCEVMAVHPSFQRQGLGSKVFLAGGRLLPKQGPIFTDGELRTQAPPKYGLFASIPGRKMYTALGFEYKGIYADTIDGVAIDSPLMEYNKDI